MRAGALPLLAWGSLLVAALLANWIVTGDAIQVGEFGVGAGIVLGFALVLAARTREALRPGEPKSEGAPEAVPQASLAAAGAGIATCAIAFGLVWSSFVVYFGAGLLLACAARLRLEHGAQRSSRQQLGGRR